MKSTYTLLLVPAVIAATTFLNSAVAATLEESFSTLPTQDWTAAYSGGNAGQQTAAAPRIDTYAGNNWLRLQRNASTSSANATYYYTGFSSLSGITSISGSVTMQLTFEGGSQAGILLGANSPQYVSPGGYMIGIVPGSGGGSGTTGGLGIYANPGNHVTYGEMLAFTPWVSSGTSIIDNSHSYRLDFVVTETAISATLWQMGSDGTSIASVPYAQVQHTFDEPANLGSYIGLRSAFGSNATAYYRDLNVTVAIPETGKLPVLAGVVAALLIALRARRKYCAR